MRKLYLAIVSLTLFCCGSIPQEMNKEFDVSEGKMLNINLKTGGSIKIQGWKKEKVKVDVEFFNCDAEDFDFDAIKQLAGKLEKPAK